MPEIFQGTPWNSQNSLSVSNMTTSTVTSTSSESGLVGPVTTEALVTSSSRRTSTSTRSGPTSSRLGSVLQTPVRSISTNTDPGSLELISTETVLPSTSTTTELEPLEALQWPLSPSVTSPGFLSPARTISSSPWLTKTTLLSPLSPTTQQFFPITREDQWLSARSPTSTKRIATATSETKSLKIAQWVLDLDAEPDRGEGEVVPPVRAEREHTGDDWDHINSTSHLLELENTETEADPLSQLKGKIFQPTKTKLVQPQ